MASLDEPTCGNLQVIRDSVSSEPADLDLKALVGEFIDKLSFESII